MPTSLKAITATALIGIGTLSLSPPANAGWGCGWGCGWGPVLAGFGIGAMVGSALAGPPIYAGPPPPPVYYGPAGYGPYYGPLQACSVLNSPTAISLKISGWAVRAAA